MRCEVGTCSGVVYGINIDSIRVWRLVWVRNIVEQLYVRGLGMEFRWEREVV